jgi:hypothetical protein
MHDPPGGDAPGGFFYRSLVMPRACRASGGPRPRRLSKRYGVLNQPLARVMTVRVRCITNRIAKILAFPVVYIHDAS